MYLLSFFRGASWEERNSISLVCNKQESGRTNHVFAEERKAPTPITVSL